MPYADFQKSAQCLDRQRLGKQRVECLQILRCLLGITQGWRNHPAVRMWKSSPLDLAEYGLIICNEWIRRGYRDSCKQQIISLVPQFSDCYTLGRPSWFGDMTFHHSHQSNLLRKLPEHYLQFGWEVPNNLPYVWPV